MKKMLLIAIIALPLLVFAEKEPVGYLGVSTTELNEAMKTALDLEYGVLVEKVHEDSPAEKADINVGDVILEIDEDKITDYKVLKNIVKEKPNIKVKIKISRSKKSITKNVVLGERIKTRISFDIDIPDMEELKELLCKGSKELKEQMAKLKNEIDKIKDDIENLKKQIK
jgi:C-terminal processing protease CtpA/Prc